MKRSEVRAGVKVVVTGCGAGAPPERRGVLRLIGIDESSSGNHPRAIARNDNGQDVSVLLARLQKVENV